jgi:hypothetical protein
MNAFLNCIRLIRLYLSLSFQQKDHINIEALFNIDWDRTNGQAESKEAPSNEKIEKGINESDECSLGTHSCDKHAWCINTRKGYKCQCKCGYIKSPHDDTCIDINECTAAHALNGKSSCRKNQKCVNKNGSHVCECKEGFKLNDEGECEDKDECIDNPCSERKNTHCVNTPGSYNCHCNKGSKLNGNVCVKESECNGDHQCAKNMICEESKCVCKFGLEYNQEKDPSFPSPTFT